MARRRPRYLRHGVGSNQYAARGVSQAAERDASRRALRFGRLARSGPDAASVDATMPELIAEGFDAYRSLCRAQGVDPEVELTHARLAGGSTAIAWAAARLQCATRGEKPLDPTILVDEARLMSIFYPSTRVNPPALFLFASTGETPLRWAMQAIDGDLRLLAANIEHPSPRVRAEIAGHTYAPADWWERLADDPSVEVRVQLVRFGRVSADTMVAYATDPQCTPVLARRLWMRRELPDAAAVALRSHPLADVRAVAPA